MLLRTSFGDDLFLRRHRGLGSPVVNQFAWWHDEPVPPDRVDALARALADGALGRRADRALVPGARDRWSRASAVPVVRRGSGLAPGAVLDWLRAQAGATDLDPAAGPGWALGLADLTGGGSVLSLVVSHAVADGGAMLDAVRRAATGTDPLRAPERPGLAGALVGDLRDAGGQVRDVVRWWRERQPAPPSSPTASPAPVRDRPGWRPPLVVVELATAGVGAAAETAGGSVNAWFVAWVADVVGRVRATTAPSVLALPVSTREPDDHRANATRIARVEVSPGERDLGVVRAACKAAYERLAAGPGAEPVPLALVQMLPDLVVRRLPVPPSAAALASNLGAPGAGFDAPVGVPVRAAASIAHHPGADAAEMRAIGGGVAAWASTCGARTTLVVSGLDPDRLADDAALDDHVTAALAAWGLTGTRW